MFHRPTLLTSTCTREVEVSLTPTLILARRAGSEKSRTEPEFGQRVLIERPVLRALGSRLLIPPPIPSADAAAVVHPTRPTFLEGEARPRECRDPSTVRLGTVQLSSSVPSCKRDGWRVPRQLKRCRLR